MLHLNTDETQVIGDRRLKAQVPVIELLLDLALVSANDTVVEQANQQFAEVVTAVPFGFEMAIQLMKHRGCPLGRLGSESTPTEWKSCRGIRSTRMVRRRYAIRQ